MAGSIPDGLEPARHRDLEGRAIHPWARRAVLALFATLAILALANVTGQRSTTTSAAAPAATLSVRAPAHLRGGLLFQTRFTVVARHTIQNPKLVLTPGWFDGMTLNTIEPAAGQEGSRNGNLVLSYDSLKPGRRLVVWMEWQVNPTNVERRRLHAELYDGGRRITGFDRTVTVFP